MINIIYDILLLLIGIYVAFVGFSTRGIIKEVADADDSESKIPKEKQLLIQCILGIIMVLISVYKLYSRFT